MKRAFQFMLRAILCFAMTSPVDAAETAPKSSAARPYLSIFASSIDRLVQASDVIFDTADRDDLATSVDERLKSFRELKGIDRTKPLGVMSVFRDTESFEIVCLPVVEIDELLKTFTMGIVGYREVSPSRYEIDRPGAPYHVLVRNGYAYLADAPALIESLRVSPAQLLRDHRDRYDLVLMLDLKQLPQSPKTRYVEALRAQIEPYLQPKDDEATETAGLRKAIGKLVLDVIERLTIDTASITIGGALNQETRSLTLDVVIEATEGSPLAASISRLTPPRSELAALISPSIPAGLAVNLPLGGIVDQMLGDPAAKSNKEARLEAAVQLVGSGIGDFSLIAALRGDDAIQLNKVIPQLVIKLDNSGTVTKVRESFGVHREVLFHSLTPREIPIAVKKLVGDDVEIIVGQGTESLWVGLGQPDTLLERVEEAIDLVQDSSDQRRVATLIKAQFQAKQLPELVASDLLPNIDVAATRSVFEKGDDRFSVTLEPVGRSGLKLSMEAERGFVRLVGHDWSQQIERIRQATQQNP